LLLIAMIADSRGRTRKLQILAQNGQLTQERFDALMGKDQRRALAITVLVALGLLLLLIVWAIIRTHL
jgi:predicted nucleic acid-binding Zn ribbon protein